MTPDSAKQLLVRFSEIVALQRRCCEQGDPERALDLMSERNELFDRLTEVLAADYELSAADAVQMNELLQNILTDDTLLQEALHRHKSELEQKRLRLRQGRKLIRGYRAPIA